MISIAHASRLEAMKTRIKKQKVQKGKKKAEWRALTKEEQDAKIAIRNSKTVKEEIQTAKWDLDHNQYPRTKYQYMANLIEQRFAEIEELPDGERSFSELEELRRLQKKVEE